jgi:hypothetical protein
MKTPEPDDFPFADLLGLKRKNLTPEQEVGLKLMQIAKEHLRNKGKNLPEF